MLKNLIITCTIFLATTTLNAVELSTVELDINDLLIVYEDGKQIIGPKNEDGDFVEIKTNIAGFTVQTAATGNFNEALDLLLVRYPTHIENNSCSGNIKSAQTKTGNKWTVSANTTYNVYFVRESINRSDLFGNATYSCLNFSISNGGGDNSVAQHYTVTGGHRNAYGEPAPSCNNVCAADIHFTPEGNSEKQDGSWINNPPNFLITPISN